MGKIKNLEFLRVIGCLAIVLLHLFKTDFLGVFRSVHFYNNIMHFTRDGQKAVELFFILSGFFFAFKLNTAASLWEFLKKKIIRLYPVLIGCIILSGIISLFGILKFDLYSNFLVLCGALATPFDKNMPGVQVRPYWYVSGMLWCLLTYYYLLKNFNKKFVNLIIFVITFVTYALVIQVNGGKINNGCPTIYYIVTSKLLRAFAGIGLGYFIGNWWRENGERISQISLNIYQKLLCTVAELACLFFIIFNLMFHKVVYKNDMIFIVIFAITIMLFVAKKGYISQVLNDTKLGDISVFFAKYTYSIYMVHAIVLYTAAGSVWKYHKDIVFLHPYLNFCVTMLVMLGLGVVMYHFVEEPCMNYFKNRQNADVAKVLQER